MQFLDKIKTAAACRGVGLMAGLGVFGVSPAEAHVQWFAPYIVNAPPQPLIITFANPWFWLGMGIVFVFFSQTVMLERSAKGPAALDILDRLTSPLWRRLDDYIRAIMQRSL